MSSNMLRASLNPIANPANPLFSPIFFQISPYTWVNLNRSGGTTYAICE